MKKLMFCAATLAVLGFSSCRKAYTCKCEIGGGSTTLVNKRELSKQSLGDARAECDKGDSQAASTECEIEL